MNSPVAMWRLSVSTGGLTATWVVLALGTPYAAQNARQIIAEVQRRTDTTSQQYEGLLQVVDAKAKVADKHWTFERLGSHGREPVRAAIHHSSVPALAVSKS